MLPILQNGDAMLREHSIPVPEELFGTPKLRKLLDEMIEVLDTQADGVALAGPQVGIMYRIFIVRYDRMQDERNGTEPGIPDLGVYINPEFVKASRRRTDMPEGCLSVRNIYGTTLRHERATVRARDFNGTKFERGGGGILAQAFQHEIDHLDGILFIDHAEEMYENERTGETPHESAA